jgi:hypothetical protein
MSKLGSLFGGGDEGGSGILARIEKEFGPQLKTAREAKQRRDLETARRRELVAAQRRKGRRASILPSGAGVTEPLGSLGRPGATQLGG